MSVYKLTNDPLKGLLKNFNLEINDDSLGTQKLKALSKTVEINIESINKLFLNKISLNYISKYFSSKEKELRIVTSPIATNTCYEKSNVLEDWDPINVIKAFYLESVYEDYLYALIIPETGCFIDRNHVRIQLGLSEDMPLTKSTYLPSNMEFGTCSPFIQPEDISTNGGPIKYIIFDTESLHETKSGNTIDDFSFHKDHRLSIQMNYHQCYQMLKDIFPGAVIDREILPLSFKERFIRKKGKIKVDYEFKSLNYRTAKFINANHGYGDVSIINDHIDELFIPDLLSLKNIS